MDRHQLRDEQRLCGEVGESPDAPGRRGAHDARRVADLVESHAAERTDAAARVRTVHVAAVARGSERGVMRLRCSDGCSCPTKCASDASPRRRSPPPAERVWMCSGSPARWRSSSPCRTRWKDPSDPSATDRHDLHSNAGHGGAPLSAGARGPGDRRCSSTPNAAATAPSKCAVVVSDCTHLTDIAARAGLNGRDRPFGGDRLQLRPRHPSRAGARSAPADEPLARPCPQRAGPVPVSPSA